MNFTKFNKSQFEKIDWGRNTEGFSFRKINDLVNEGKNDVTCYGFFFTKSENYGLQPNAILADCLLNLPTHLKDSVESILNDKEAVEEIKKGGLALHFRQYESKRFGNKKCWGVDFRNTTVNETESQPPLF